MHRPVVTAPRVRLLRGAAAGASTVAALAGVLLTGGPTAAQRDVIRTERVEHVALVHRVRVLEKVTSDEAAWNDRQRHRAAVATGAAVRAHLAAELAALQVRLDAVRVAVVGAPVEAGQEGLVDAANAAVASAATVLDAGSLVGARPLVEVAEAAGSNVTASVQARAAAEAAAAAAAQAAADQAAAEQAAAARAAAGRDTVHRPAAPRSAPRDAAPEAGPTGGGSSAWDDVQAAAAGVAGSYGLSVTWVGTTACGQSGSVSTGSFSVRGCSTTGSSTIQLSFGDDDPGTYQGSRSKLVAYVRAVTLHETAHRLIERLTGTMFPVARFEPLADAYAATYLGMPAGLASYGFGDEDVATAEAIHDGRW
ncbi:hypothetical protein [Cellulomonas sp. URHB0016]